MNEKLLEENLHLKLEVAELKMMVLKLQHQIVEKEWGELKSLITASGQEETGGAGNGT